MEKVQARIEMKRACSFSAEEDASVSKCLAELLAMGKWCGFPGLPCLVVFFDSLLSSLVPVCLSFSLLQPTYAPVRLLHSPRCSAQTFFPPPFEGSAAIAWFSFSVSNNSALLNTFPPLRLSVLFMSLCVVSLAALFLLLLFCFSFLFLFLYGCV